jgi:hypothetical protein
MDSPLRHGLKTGNQNRKSGQAIKKKKMGHVSFSQSFVVSRIGAVAQRSSATFNARQNPQESQTC